MTVGTERAEEVDRAEWSALLDDIEMLRREMQGRPMPLPGVDVDVAGRLRHEIRLLTTFVRGLEAEMPDNAEGNEYRVKQERSAERSYNTGRLIDAFGEQRVSFMDLHREDVVRISWQWSNLRHAASKYGVTLRITPNEIGDTGEMGVEAPMVGEVWKHRNRIVGKDSE